MATDKPLTSSGDLWIRFNRDRPHVPGWNVASSSRSQLAKENPLPPAQQRSIRVFRHIHVVIFHSTRIMRLAPCKTLLPAQLACYKAAKMDKKTSTGPCPGAHCLCMLLQAVRACTSPIQQSCVPLPALHLGSAKCITAQFQQRWCIDANLWP